MKKKIAAAVVTAAFAVSGFGAFIGTDAEQAICVNCKPSKIKNLSSGGGSSSLYGPLYKPRP